MLPTVPISGQMWGRCKNRASTMGTLEPPGYTERGAPVAFQGNRGKSPFSPEKATLRASRVELWNKPSQGSVHIIAGAHKPPGRFLPCLDLSLPHLWTGRLIPARTHSKTRFSQLNTSEPGASSPINASAGVGVRRAGFPFPSGPEENVHLTISATLGSEEHRHPSSCCTWQTPRFLQTSAVAILCRASLLVPFSQPHSLTSCLWVPL